MEKVDANVVILQAINFSSLENETHKVWTRFENVPANKTVPWLLDSKIEIAFLYEHI